MDEPAVTEFEFRRVLVAVADPIRLSIVRQLAEVERDLSSGAIELPVKASTATKAPPLIRGSARRVRPTGRAHGRREAFQSW